MRKIILPLLLLTSIGCKKNTPRVEPEDQVTLKEYRFDDDRTSQLMFQDGESMELLTSESRKYEISRVLRIKALNDKTIEIANFAPIDIEDATILMKIEGENDQIRLLKIKKIRAHAVQEIAYPFAEGQTQFKTVNNQPIDLSAYQKPGIPAAKVSFDFDGESVIIKKLKLLSKLKWTVKYHDYDTSDNHDDNWKDNIEAKDIRRFTGLIINMAYLFQSEKTRAAIIAEPLYNNDKILFSTLQKEQIYDKFLNIPFFRCGVVTNVSGLGGGGTFGVGNNTLTNYLTTDICSVVVHEMGHMIGYSHSSNMTYPSAEKRGAVVAIGNIYKEQLGKNELPVQKSNYYKQSDL